MNDSSCVPPHQTRSRALCFAAGLRFHWALFAPSRGLTARHQYADRAKRRIQASSSSGFRLFAAFSRLFRSLVHKIHSGVVDHLGANLVGPQQKIRQCVTNLVFRKLGDLANLCLSFSTAANGLAHAICRREFPEHPRYAPRRKAGFRVNGESRPLRLDCRAMLDPRVLIFTQSLPSLRARHTPNSDRGSDSSHRGHLFNSTTLTSASLVTLCTPLDDFQ
jgi:hypothetical protein